MNNNKGKMYYTKAILENFHTPSHSQVHSSKQTPNNLKLLSLKVVLRVGETFPWIMGRVRA